MRVNVHLSFVAAAAAVLWGCSTHDGPGVGAEKGRCYSNSTCNQGLSCFSNRCVRYNGIGDGGFADSDGSAGADGGGANGLGGSAVGGGSQGAAGASAGSGTAGNGGVTGTTGDAGNAGTAGVTGAAGTQGAGGMTASGGMTGAAGATSGGGATGAAGMVACAGTAGGTGVTPEEITVPACGNTPGTTSSAYSGLVTMTVSGLIVNTPGNPLEDAFYGVDANNTSLATAACPDCFRYNRLHEGACLCSSECATTSHRVTDLLVGPYPAFRSGHDYTVTLDLGTAAPERLNFGIHDCGCADNSGTHKVTLTPIPIPVCNGGSIFKVGDLNLDHKLDIVETNVGDGNVGVLLSNGDGTFQAARKFSTDKGARSVAIGDLNGDGKPDLAVVNQDANDLSILINTTP